MAIISVGIGKCLNKGFFDYSANAGDAGVVHDSNMQAVATTLEAVGVPTVYLLQEPRKRKSEDVQAISAQDHVHQFV